MYRRDFLTTIGIGTMGLLSTCKPDKKNLVQERINYTELDEILARPVLKTDYFKEPVIIDSLDLLRYEDNFICRVISKDGAVGISVSNNYQMIHLYPIFVGRLQSFFIGKDARNWEQLLEEVYVHQSNYKLQNLALWVPLATIEFAVLDMLGRIAGQPIGALIGDIVNSRIAVYQANNFRGKSAEESIDLISKQVEVTKARALKIKVGGRMSKNADHPPGRSEKLIPLVRETFGTDMTLYADSNGSYDTQEAIRIGRILEDYQYDFYEEPVPFDWYEETKEVCNNLKIPIAGGEQEPSMHMFRWLIGNKALQIIQPDIFYFGGMIRSMKVALLAHGAGLTCTPHISGSGLGYLYMMHFVSALPNAGPYHEFKGFNENLPLEAGPDFAMSKAGTVEVPQGPGLGVQIDSNFLNLHKQVKS